MTEPAFDLSTVTLSPEAQSVAPPTSGVAERRYLLVFEVEGCRAVPLPASGEMVIGRAPDADVRIEDVAASRHHAKVVLRDDEVTLVDLESRNGTTLNGQRAVGPRPLRRGDVVVIGGTQIVVHRDASPRARSVVEERDLRTRAEDEIARLARSPRPLAMGCVRVARGAVREAVGDAVASALDAGALAAWGGPEELLVLLADLEEEPGDVVRRLVEALPGAAAAGFAEYPGDGGDVDALVAGARAAAGGARPGDVVAAADMPATREIAGRSYVVVEPAMARIHALLERLARSTLPVLVTGETGTGKENAAAVVHHASARAKGPFVTINCAALPETLVESELFGHEKGAFSGAIATKPGLLEAASGGTLFLDEVGELSLATQAKLLRVLETQRVTRVGALAERAVDVRIVAATNRDLVEEVRCGRFRQDLLFRLGAATVVLPPLRDRRRELPVLARTLLSEACARAARPRLGLSTLAMQRVLAHAWPGNVRELKNAMEYVAATAAGPDVEAWELPPLEGRLTPLPPANAETAPGAATAGRPFRPLADEIRELEKRRIAEALAAAGGVQTRAAELIGMPVRTLFAKLKLHGIAPRVVPRA